MFKGEKGFTVVEVLFGIGLFGILIPSIVFSAVSISGLNDKASDLTTANIVAERKFEQLRNEGYNSLDDGTYDFSGDLGPTFGSPKEAEYEVTTPEAGIKSVEITIEYTVNDQLKELDYEMLISELGVAQ